jgi:hypothetical protein
MHSIVTDLVKKAYTIPVFPTTKQKEDGTNKFRDTAYVSCISPTQQRTSKTQNSGRAERGEDWVKILDNSQGSLFVSLKTIQRVADKSTTWSIINFHQTQKSAASRDYLSIKVNEEFQCSGRMFRRLAFSSHQEAMARGETVATSSKPSEWRSVPPGSVTDSLFQVACDK